MATILDRGPVAAEETERQTLERLARVLTESAGLPKLVGPDGEAIALPRSVLRALRQVVGYLT